MANIIDTIARPRHPEKANRPETPLLRKPDWIRVKAPGSAIYTETQKIVRDSAEGLRRIEEYSLPLENQRMVKAFGYPSSLSKILTIRRDGPAGRTTLILVKEKLGF